MTSLSPSATSSNRSIGIASDSGADLLGSICRMALSIGRFMKDLPLDERLDPMSCDGTLSKHYPLMFAIDLILSQILIHDSGEGSIC